MIRGALTTSLAPDGKQIYYVLLPTPNTSAGIDWDVVGPRYRDEAVARLEALGYVGFGDGIEVEDVTTPADWQPGEPVIVPPPGSCGSAKDRMDDATVHAADWFFATRDVSEEEVLAAIRV